MPFVLIERTPPVIPGQLQQWYALSVSDRQEKTRRVYAPPAELLVIEGQFQSGEMILAGSDLTSTGQKRLVRGIWKPVSDGVRETAVTSLDSGKSWQTCFDLIFRPHHP